VQIHNLVQALLAGDLLAARQFVADAQRARVQWQQLERPVGLNERELAVAASVVELLAARASATPPSWTTAVGAISELLVLDPGLEQMPRSFARAKISGPESLLKRNIVALPDFLDVA
jgi:hypothetical protein